MTEWIKTSDRLPEKGTLVKVKTPVFHGSEEFAYLVNTDRGTVGWLPCGVIYVALDQVTEWRAVERDQ